MLPLKFYVEEAKVKRLPIILLALAGTSCASRTIERTDVAIELQPRANVKFSALRTLRHGKSVIVAGNILSMSNLTLHGHVDIAGFVRGVMVRSTTAEPVYFLPRRPRPAFFRTVLPDEDEAIDLIRVSYDIGLRHDKES
ncbi:hypothetical protein N5J77_24300 [Sphingobium yanoikuyae]|uniref:Uncharacterized protein n=1 Tax=Sphingobium yanoikuyae TaxID=13690 RepID=A0AA42WYP7_SPHYA|nr:hypothetical protein [Sphingobium yanoikuyae]MDH2134259.1 hypothetical protein [Sphingobium yanoikuyae]MDH2151506.1 hypothetical protein [Sphingobium yanoikuyae]MDH2169663.1 hypothetical protein [Sphingobium yanoikuyae]